MIKKSQRLNRLEVEFLKKTGVRVGGKFYSLVINKTSQTKFAVLISKKINKLAVKRNKLKREILKTTQEIKIESNHHILIIPKHTINTTPPTIYLESLKTQIEKTCLKK